MNPAGVSGFSFSPADLGARGKSANTGVPEEPLHLVVCLVEAFPDGPRGETEGPGGAGKAGVARKGLAVVAEAPAEPSY